VTGRRLTLARRLLAALAAVLLGGGVARAAGPPAPTLPARAPAGARATHPLALNAAARGAFEHSCPQFAASAARGRGGWTCASTAAIAQALGHTANDLYHWADRRTVHYGYVTPVEGAVEIGAVYRPLNITMHGKQVQHGMKLSVLEGPSIWPFWAAGCRRYYPDDRADCGDASGQSNGWRKKYSTGWNFYPWGGSSKYRTIFTIDVYAKGYSDPTGIRGAFPFPRVVSGQYTCPRVGRHQYRCQFG
jgi:hypothetical protein